MERGPDVADMNFGFFIVKDEFVNPGKGSERLEGEVVSIFVRNFGAILNLFS
jgi:hypothetical protein